MKYTLIALLLGYGIAKAQTSTPARPNPDKLFYGSDIESLFDSVAIRKHVVDGRPALTLTSKGESITCMCLSKDDTGTSIEALLRKKGSPLICPWPYTRLEDVKRTK